MEEDPSEAFRKMKIATRDQSVDLPRTGYLKGVGLDHNGTGCSPEIQKTRATKGRGSFMNLPPEIRLKVYPHLLVVDEGITLSASQHVEGAKPSVAILQTCQIVNQEATPILYKDNDFTVFLDLNPGPAYLVCFPMSLRWSSIPHINAIAYKTKTMALSSFEAKFVVSGPEIIKRFTARDIHYSPVSPDKYLALGIKDWVSREVVRATVSAFHTSMSAAIMGHIPLPGLP